MHILATSFDVKVVLLSSHFLDFLLLNVLLLLRDLLDQNSDFN